MRSQGAPRRARASLRAELAAAAITVLLCVALVAVTDTTHPASAAARSATAASPSFVPALAAPLSGASLEGALAAAPKPGSGGWYWPVGSEDFGSYAGFLAPRGATVHVAQDMHAPQGHPVYAIGDGTVWISRSDTGGYGVNGAPGGCVIIVHRTAAGEEFRALYGHLSDLRFKAGAHVSGGDVIGVTNGCDHLHFGIHPSAAYRGGNPYAGEVPKTWTDHGGWVDPVKYLRTHPYAATYSAPALAQVKIATDAPPHDFGAAAGVAYWTYQAAFTTHAYDLVTGARRVLGDGETAPPFDAVRYLVKALPAPAVGFSVRDRQPVLTLEAAPASPPWGAAATLKATLTNAAGKPFVFAQLQLDRLDGASWTALGQGRTGAEGTHEFALSPARRTVVRVQFLPPADQPAAAAYVTPESPVVTVAPKVLLSTPELPATVELSVAVTVSGTIVPRHPAGKGSVDFEFQRLDADGPWVKVKTVEPALSDTAGGSAYSYEAKFAKAGSWRVRAVHPADAAHDLTAGDWRPFTVE